MTRAQLAAVAATFGGGWCVEVLYTEGDSCVAAVARLSPMGGREAMTIYATADDAVECTLSGGVPYDAHTGEPCGAFIW